MDVDVAGAALGGVQTQRPEGFKLSCVPVSDVTVNGFQDSTFELHEAPLIAKLSI